MRIKLFADGANITEMYQLYIDNKVQGFTTNPTLMRKAGVRDYESFAKQVINLMPDVPISFEVFSDDLKEIERQARIISSWGDNVYVKIPITNTKGESTLPIINKLYIDGIKINITAVLTLEQVKEISENLSSNSSGCLSHNSKNKNSIVSVFAGRIADTGRDPIPIMQKSYEMLKYVENCELLWASTREVLNIYQADMCCCDIITVTPDILKKLSMHNKDLKELSLDTVRMFYNDAKEAGYQI